ncbi:MAG: hypothetical protein PSX37_01890 [bacterium]|nr:hypothetical protein [bacterium]
MSLPWVRLDANIYSHDKVLWLLAQKDGYRAFTVYTFSLAYAGGHGTDGLIETHVLPALKGTERIARLLVEARMWEYDEAGWRIRNWDERQELSVVTERKREASRRGGLRRSCEMHHGKECGCWRTATLDNVRPLGRATNG